MECEQTGGSGRLRCGERVIEISHEKPDIQMVTRPVRVAGCSTGVLPREPLFWPKCAAFAKFTISSYSEERDKLIEDARGERFEELAMELLVSPVGRARDWARLVVGIMLITQLLLGRSTPISLCRRAPIR
jgi:hypothetical protein